ncbi:type II CAAX endopeptidase family protein [Streptomyces sp. CRN 30]|uniref:CPBP family intramembrane glutamic endopeptidase n=1 Tax=Streptomyces sp. CRN 30 TaxID=3075613 RepID=UPI002A802831|nr:type II CAAX endopeptidase family protein [Streptomyces sp. CRN 30]
MKFVWQLLTVVAVSAAGGQGLAAAADNPYLQLTLGGATAVLAVFLYGWVVRRTEHRPAAEVSREGAASAFGRGLLIGAAMFTAVIVNLLTSGYYDVDGLGSPKGALGLFGFMAAAAVTEELLYRGVLFRWVEKLTGTYLALVLTGLLFGASHLLNPHASLLGAAAIAIEAGFMLTAAYVATRRLWVAIGIHFGWNFAASGVFSTEVSGNDTPQGLLDSATSGPRLLTGGDFGPEASVYSVLFGVLVTIAFMWLAHRRGYVVPPRRADRAAAAPTLVR